MMGVAALLETALMQSRQSCFVEKRAIDSQEINDNAQALQDSITETRLKALLKALPAGVIVLDGQGLVQECNPAAIDLLDEPLLGLSWRKVIDRAFDASRNSGQDALTRKGRIVSISTCPLEEGVPGQIILLQDVTEKRHLQEKYDQQNRLASMGKMAAQLAHQIRTPISAALLYASHLKSPQLDESKRLRFANKMLTRIQSLEHLINDMLLFSRSGMENRESLSVQQLLLEVQQTMLIPEDKRGISLQFDYQLDHECYIFGNRNLLVSGLINLLNNALHAISEASGGIAGIRVSQPVHGAIDFSIYDNGSGILTDQIERIFEPFYTTKESGTGLGLAVVKAIANAHDGELWLDQTDPSGSIFRMRIPTQIQTLRNND